MAKSQQPELHRSGSSPADPASAKTAADASVVPPATEAGAAPVPEANRPGHHPEHEQDKPVEAFVARTTRRRPARRTPRSTGAGASPGTAPAGGRNRAAAARRPADDLVAGAGGGGEDATGDGTARITPYPRARAVPGPAVTGGGEKTGALYVMAPAVALADAARRPERAWSEIGESRTRWLAQIALLPGLGPWRYATTIRPRLQAAERAPSISRR
jgi:hypothetical protein